ncbi:uncharacterized protein LOC118478587, partial [Aplysia californica]|uniref:Uncharacterized protein LOC118478587 n=1 Tax=Aplysia californica TaxID=6500 RepID=A0ABM1W125_APLCA
MEFEIVKESVLTMTEDDLMQIPLETFCECSHFYVEFLDHRCEHNPRTCEAFWEKILESCMVTGLPVVNVLEDLPGYFIQHFVPPEDMEHLDMNDTAILERIADIPLDDIHATVLYRKLEKELGNVSFYDHPDFNKNPSAYKLYSKGMTTDHAHSMRADDTFIDMLPTLATSFEQSNKKKTAMIYEKIAESFNLGSARDVCVDESMVADVAPYFIQASEEDMRKLTPDSRYNILKQIGETKKYTRKMTRPKIRLFFALQLETKDVRAPYDSADIEAVGKYLWCGMDASHVTHVSSQAIEEYLHVFDSCDQLDQETRKELSDTYVNYVGGIFSIIDQPDKAEAMGSLLMYVDITTASTLPAKKDKLEKFEVLMSEVLELAESRSRRLQEKSGRDIPEEEKETEKRFRKSLTHGLFGVKHTGGGPLDCRSLMAFHGDLSFLNETDIVDMPMREFENCIEEFQKSDWNDDQFMAIGTKLKEGFGNDTSMWNPTMTMKAGPLIRGLDPMDLLNMTFTKDTLAVLGQFDLGANMSGDIVDKYARDMGMFDMSSLTVDELGALGKMVCGIAADMIATMDARTVSEAARHLKEAECLDTDQLEEFGKKLEEDLGRDWSHFTPDKIEELGVLMGGAPKDILETLGEQQISSID